MTEWRAQLSTLLDGQCLPVVVTRHAAQQAAERFGASAYEVRKDVECALAAGRISAERPAFLGPSTSEDMPARCFAWTTDCRRGFVLKAVPSEALAGVCWLVVTALAACAEEEAA